MTPLDNLLSAFSVKSEARKVGRRVHQNTMLEVGSHPR